MAGMTRRDFLGTAGKGAAAAGVVAATGVSLRADPLGIPIGSQTYPSRVRIGEGKFVDVLKEMYAADIRQIELCSPGYQWFKGLADGKQTKKIIEDNGLKCVSSHFSMAEFRNGLPQAIQWAQDVGLTQMGTATMGGKLVNGVTSLEELKRATDEYNKMAAVTKRAGVQMFLHNEGIENSRLEDGRLSYPIVLELLDPDLVKMQFQMSSMRTIGNPIMYFTLHPGRFISAHVHGVNLETPIPARGMSLPVKPDPTAPPAGRGRGPGTPAVAVGEDSVDWPAVFTAAKIGGLKNYYIEQEQANGWEAMVKGAAFLKTLNVT